MKRKRKRDRIRHIVNVDKGKAFTKQSECKWLDELFGLFA